MYIFVSILLFLIFYSSNSSKQKEKLKLYQSIVEKSKHQYFTLSKESRFHNRYPHPFYFKSSPSSLSSFLFKMIGMNKSNTDKAIGEDLEELESLVLLVINEPNDPRSIISSGPTLMENFLSKCDSIIQNTGINTKYWLSILKTTFYFFLWYFFTVVYNVSNKRLLDEVPSPLSLATLQLLLGIPVFLPLWAMKPVRYPWKDLYSHMKIASMHGLGNWASVVAYGSGSVSFAHVVKALEPVVASLLSIIITGRSFPITVYLSIIPIVFGVGIASATEITFSWIGFISAMLSNVFYQMRMVLAKEVMNEEKPHISPANLFRVITILAALELIPITLLVEGFRFQKDWIAALERGISQHTLLSNLFISGVSFYMYNEVAFWLLEIIHPVTHAVGNTIKRIVIILASVIILKSPVNAVGITGAILAVSGTLMYSLAQQRYKSNVS